MVDAGSPFSQLDLSTVVVYYGINMREPIEVLGLV